MIFALSVVSFTGLAHAQPLETIDIAVVDYDNDQATINIVWNYDQTTTNYEVGCVSCMPNISKSVGYEGVVLSGITPLPNTSNALLYVIAFNSDGEINNAKQILIDLKE